MTRCKSIIKRLIPATCSWVLLLSTTAAFFIFPCRRLHEEYHYSITIAQAIITFFVISNLFATTFVDPGVIKRASPDEDKDDFHAPIHKEVQIRGHVVRMKWCSTCQFYRPPRCSHCSVCDNCIEKFDHHCPWVNNCIGRRNYRHFFFFLIFLTIHMITIFIWCLILVINYHDKTADTEVIVAIILLVIIGLFFIPIVGLTGFHIVLVARGRTTNEQVTKKFNRQINPFSNGIVYNCAYTICGPRYPGLYKPNHGGGKTLRKKFGRTGNRRNSRKTSELKIYMDTTTAAADGGDDTRPEGGCDPKKVLETCPDNFSLSDNPKDGLLQGRNDCAVVGSSATRKPSSRRSGGDDSNVPVVVGNRFSANAVGLNGMKNHEQESHIVTMHHTENGTKETTFIALPSSVNRPSETKPATGMFHPAKISASKSTSINEISSHLKPSPAKTPAGVNVHGPEGGMLIYYSPDAGIASDGYLTGNNRLFNSETELQKFGSHLAAGANQFLYIDEEPPVPYMMKTTTATTMTTTSSTTSDNYHPHHHQGRFYSNTGGASHNSSSKRPMPFQKALEISNKIDLQQQQQQQKNQESSTTNRQSQYEMNYEISV